MADDIVWTRRLVVGVRLCAVGVAWSAAFRRFYWAEALRRLRHGPVIVEVTNNVLEGQFPRPIIDIGKNHIYLRDAWIRPVAEWPGVHETTSPIGAES